MSQVINFWKVLFDSEEFTCYGNQYETKVLPVPFNEDSLEEFFCINPLDSKKDHGFYLKDNYDEYTSRRADVNVSKFRNFMFEMDGTSLEDQEKVLNSCGIPFSTIVFSGSKSYHAILSLESPLTVDPHVRESIMHYKNIWARLAAKIDKCGREVLSLDKSETIVDKSCRNPSRFSRYPGSYRKSKDSIQTIKSVGSRISKDDFDLLLDSCPVVLQSNIYKSDRPEHVIYDEKLFFDIASNSLRRSIMYAPFGAPSGMYKELYKLTLWAIDDTNIDKDLLVELLNKYTFKRLIEDHNYPSHKLMVGVEHALKYKGLL